MPDDASHSSLRRVGPHALATVAQMYPKQFCKLMGGPKVLFPDPARRRPAEFAAPIIVTGTLFRFHS